MHFFGSQAVSDLFATMKEERMGYFVTDRITNTGLRLVRIVFYGQFTALICQYPCVPNRVAAYVVQWNYFYVEYLCKSDWVKRWPVPAFLHGLEHDILGLFCYRFNRVSRTCEFEYRGVFPIFRCLSGLFPLLDNSEDIRIFRCVVSIPEVPSFFDARKLLRDRIKLLHFAHCSISARRRSCRGLKLGAQSPDPSI